MRNLCIGLGATIATACLAGAASGHSEPHRERGRPARGFFYLPRGERPGNEWEVIARRGRPGPAVKQGEAISGHSVQADGEFRLKLLPGTYTFGGWRQRPGEIGRLCGLTSITVGARKPIPVIRVRCTSGHSRPHMRGD